VVVIERGRHPRFALGESSTPLAAICLERLAADYGLPDLAALAGYGRWSRELPHLRRGLKRGFTFYAHRHGRRYENGETNSARLLVAASPVDELADAHWLRSDVDHHLVERARAEGVEVVEDCEITDLRRTPSGWRVGGERPRGRLSLEASFVVDGSGAGAFLPRRLGLPDRRYGARAGSAGLPDTGLVFAHFEGVASFVESAGGGAGFREGPYPDERAAVHHLLEEGWMYVLPFDDGRVSAGVVLDRAHPRAREWLGLDPSLAWSRCLEAYPTLGVQFGDSRPMRAPALAPRIGHWFERAGGEEWALLPSTFFFASPLFSTGIAWSLIAVERLARGLALADPRARTAAVSEYAELLATEAAAIAELTGPAYRLRHRFDAFCGWSHVYFAAASFHESWQRLADAPSPEGWAPIGFLGASDPVIRRIIPRAAERLARAVDGRDPGDLEPSLAPLLSGRNVAGLADARRRRLYPVELDSLVDHHASFGLTRAEAVERVPRLRSPAPLAPGTAPAAV
jgi:FADH2 O2-dependent halogenase